MTIPDYKSFARWAIIEGPWQGNYLDGCDVQDVAEKHGIIKRVLYDHEKHEAEGVYCMPGDKWYEFVEN